MTEAFRIITGIVCIGLFLLAAGKEGIEEIVITSIFVAIVLAFFIAVWFVATGELAFTGGES